jgi:hypothetical protein
MEAKPPNLEDLAMPAPVVSEAVAPGSLQPHRHITGHLSSVNGAAQ